MRWGIIICFFLVSSLASCGILPQHRSSWLPPERSTEADLVGTWTLVNSIYDSEAIRFNADHTFIQTYDLLGQSIHSETQGSWRIEPRPSGCRYLYMEGMRNVHLTDSAANNGNRYPNGSLMTFWEPCEDTSITMPDKVILVIGKDPHFPRGLVLLFPRNGAESTDIMLWLNKQPEVTTREPT